MASLKTIAIRLSRPDILFWTLPFMMVLLTVGTIAQKDMGLYAAQQTYFSSLIVWFFGFIPFPGGYTLIGVLFANLLMKFLLFSEWEWRKAGIILSHFGVLLLILGGLFTAITEKEGSLVIGEGDTVSVAEDYHQRELRVLKDGQLLDLPVPYQMLKDGMEITLPGMPFTIHIDKYCFNCSITQRPEDQQQGWTSPGKFMMLSPAKPYVENERNLTGIEFSVGDRKYVTFDKFPKPPEIEEDGHVYTVIMGRRQYALPFTLTLDKFTREFHPGTNEARSYRSDLTVTDGQDAWPATITMNEPLRYKGYTFYQSSFDLTGEKPYTVLSVVRNTGRVFPYISSLIMAFGMLLHIVIRMREKGGRTS